MLEALACGTPVIATPAAGGIREVLQGRPGCVIADEISAPGLASAIAGFPFEQVRDERPPRLDEYSAEHIGAQYAAVFSSVADSAG